MLATPQPASKKRSEQPLTSASAEIGACLNPGGTAEEDLAVSNLRMARSDFAFKHLDEWLDPDE
jgi:hypothetical protein